ncbi:MAG: DNA translocase FtsK 4TM domain-containing protein [Muribaculaceae bacterium]
MSNNSDIDVEMGSVPGPTRRRKKKAAAPTPQPAADTAAVAAPVDDAPAAESASCSKPAANTRNDRRQVNSFIELITSKRFHTAIGLILLAIAVTMGISAFIYVRTGVADQSLVTNQSLAQVAEHAEEVTTTGGAFGAWVAHALLVDTFGIGSFILVVYTLLLSFALFGFMKVRFWSFSFKCLFTTVALSIIAGLFTFNLDTPFHWGGSHGHYVNALLMQYADILVAYILTFLLISLLVVIYISQIISCYNQLSGKVRRAHDAMVNTARSERTPHVEPQDVPDSTSSLPVALDADTPADNVAEPMTPAADPVVGFTIDDLSQEQPSAPVTPLDVPDEPEQPTVAAEPEESAEPEDVPAGTVIVTDAAPEISIDTPDDSQPAEPQPSEPVDPEFTINVAELGANPDPANNTPAEQLPPINVRDELSSFQFPSAKLLIDRPITKVIDEQEQNDNKELIVKTLRDYGIPISRIEATIGPTVTLYEIVPAEGVRIAQIKRLEDDIALSLSALGIRIIAPIPGKGTVGIEVPNREPQTVSMFSVINSRKFRECQMALPMALGATINNDIFIEDLARMPHMLVAGATGQGKSVGLNCIIASLLYKKHPAELKFVLIDPKMVEFSLYSRLERYYLAKLPDEEDAIITDPMKALSTLSALCVEMDNRYDLLKDAGVRTVVEYNTKWVERRLNPKNGHKYMPYIVVIVDEFADLIMTAGKEISVHIARIAQKARAVGIHMIISTQRPSTDVITGMIKANFPARIAFRVASGIDSKTILDRPGAHRLIGRGDMLFTHNSKLERVQCAFIDTPEVEALVDYISRQSSYTSAYLLPEPESSQNGGVISDDLSRRDEMFETCARFVVTNSTASTSSLQRRFSIGYNKAGKIMDQLEAAHIVGPADGQRPRAVLMDSEALEAFLSQLS